MAAAVTTPLVPDQIVNPPHITNNGLTAYRMDGTWTWTVYNGAHVLQGYVQFDTVTGVFTLRTDFDEFGGPAGTLLAAGTNVIDLLRWLHVAVETAD